MYWLNAKSTFKNAPDRQVVDEVLQYLGSRTRVKKPRPRPTEQEAALQSEIAENKKQLGPIYI
jgi:hypothetical protein